MLNISFSMDLYDTIFLIVGLIGVLLVIAQY